MIYLKSLIKTPIFLAGLSGFTFWFSFNHPAFWWLALVGLIPWLSIIYDRSLAVKTKFFVGWLAGGIYALGFLVWHWDILPLDWIGINSYFISSLLIFYVWFVPAVVIGAIMGAWTVLVSKFKTGDWIDLPLLAFSWPFFEFIRSIAISILWYGNGGVLGPDWTIGFLGYVLAPGPLKSLAGWGGVYLVSAAAVAINLLIFQLVKNFRQKKQREWLAVSGVFLLIWLTSLFYFYSFSITSDSQAKLALVNTYNESFSRLEGDAIKTFTEQKKKIMADIAKGGEDPDIVIFPEDSRALLSYAVTNDQLAIKNMFAGHETLIVDSARLFDKQGFAKLTFQYLNTRTGKLSEDGKNFLVPHGEYMPYLTDFLGGVLGQSEWVTSFRHARETAPVVENKKVNVNFQGAKFKATACSEIMLPTIHSDIAASGAPLLINAASHSLFRGSPVLYRQTISMAKMRAVESNRYFVAANNFIPSFVVNNWGELVTETAWSKQAVLYATVQLVSQDTIYTKIYRFVPWLLFILSLIFGFISYRGRAKIGS